MEGSEKNFIVYKRRWLVLMAFVCVNAVMQYDWCTFSSITTDAWKFYGFQDAASGEAAISALTMIIMVGMMTLSVPASAVFHKIGWYKSVAISGIVLMCFTLLRGFIGGNSYTSLIICTIGIACTQPFIINAFGMLGSLWFPPSERGIANGWGMVSTYIGVVIAQFGTPWLMTMGFDIPGVLKAYGFLAIPMILFFVIVGREKPPTPPCDEELIERVDFASGMKALIRNKRFIMVLLVFWIMQGIYFTFTTLIEPIMQQFNNHSLDGMFIGTLGTIITVTGTIATLVLPVITDHSKSKKRLPLVRVCQFGAVIGLVLVLTGHSTGLIIAMACCLGVFLLGVTPVLMVCGYETAYPVSEGITESLMQLGANGFGFVILIFVNGVFRGQHMGTMLFFIGGMILSIILMAFVKEASMKDRMLEK